MFIIIYLYEYVPNVIDEMLLPRKGLVTVGAGMRSDPRVLPQMAVQMLLSRELARAIRALVWRFARMLSAQSTFRFVHYIHTGKE